MSNHFYQKSHVENLNQLKDLVPEQSQAFSDFNTEVFKEGALSKKEKEMIAVAIVHVTKCPYCMDSHTKRAKAEGASLGELVEAAMVAAAVEAGGAVTHSTNMQNALDSDADDVLYQRSNLKKLSKLGKQAHVGFRGYTTFSGAAMTDGNLSKKFKEVVAVAVAHATLCPYCIDVHTKNAKKLGVTNEELSEAVLVASVLLAGGSYAHIANLIESYSEE